MLQEVAGLMEFFTKQEHLVSPKRLSVLGNDYYDAYAFLNKTINELFPVDPILAYRDLRGKLFRLRADAKN